MIDLKDITLKTIADTLVVGIFLLLIVGIMMVVLGQILVVVAPTMFATGLTLTDTLLLLILIRLFNK